MTPDFSKQADRKQAIEKTEKNKKRCHSRAGGNLLTTLNKWDSRLRGNDRLLFAGMTGYFILYHIDIQ
jgi:hypothetical protein